MSEHEKNKFFDSNPFTVTPNSNDQIKCIVCFVPLSHNICYLNQVICNECCYKFYTQLYSQNNSEIPSPLVNIIKTHAAETFPYPKTIVHGLIFICDFVSHFNELIQVGALKIDSLYESLRTVDNLAIDLYRILTLKLVDSFYQSDFDTNIKIKSRILDLGMKISDIFDIRKLLNSVWATIIGEIIQDKPHSDFIKGSAIEKLKKSITMPITLDDFLSFPIDTKVGILDFLINLYLDTKECRDFISKKVENYTNLSKIRYENKQQIRQIELELYKNKSPELEAQKHKLCEENLKISSEINAGCYRSEPIGIDSDKNEYFFFKFDPSKILVLSVSENLPFEPGEWTYYSSKASLDRLISELDLSILTEYKLKQNIQKIMTKLVPDISNPKEAVINLDDSEDVIKSIKIILRNTEKKYSSFLKTTNKILDVDINQKKWRRSLKNTEDIQEICLLLLEFWQNSITPLKFQTSFNKKRGKYRRVILKVWQNSKEGCTAYENYVKTIKSKEELLLAAQIYKEVLDCYIKKKQEDCQKHDDDCYKCKDGGKLILCENCPRVAHFKCLGLKKVPETDWICEYCI
jgi:hypothetical protein